LGKQFSITIWYAPSNFSVSLPFARSEKADLKSRSDSTSGPQGDSIYTTPAGFHHHQQQQQQQQHAAAAAAAALHAASTQHAQQQYPGHGSPEAMKVRMAAMILQPPTRV